MIITNLNEGPKAEYSVTGTELTIHGVVINLSARQGDVQTVVDVCLGSDLATAAEGVGSWYVATVVIPPREYELMESGEPQALPLDMGKVELRLWTLPRVN